MNPLVEACGEDPGSICQFVFERTDSVGWAKLADGLMGVPLRIIFVVLGALLLNGLLRRAIGRFSARIEGSRESGGLKRLRGRSPSMLIESGETSPRSVSRAQTVSVVLRSLCTGIIGALTVMYVLAILGLNLAPLLAGAGVAGVAIGFGAQSLVRDFMSGVFMLIEDQYGVGDVIDVGDAVGTVEMVTLRVTRLRDINGTVWHVPNGEIRRVGNMSQKWARAILDVTVAPTTDLARALDVVKAAADDVWAMDEAKPDVLGSPEVLGIDYLGPDAATVRVQGKTRPGAQWRVSRLMRVRMAAALAAAEIDLPPSTFLRSRS